MINPNSDQDVPNLSEVEEDLYEPADPQDQSTACDYKDMQIELHGGKRKPKYQLLPAKAGSLTVPLQRGLKA